MRFALIAAFSWLGIINSGACEARGVNLALLPNGSSLTDTARVDNLKYRNDEKLRLIADNGFNLVRLRFHVAPWMDTGSTVEQSAVLRLANAFLDSADKRKVHVVVVLFLDDGHDALKVLCSSKRRALYLYAVGAIVKALEARRLGVGIEPMNEAPSKCNEQTREAVTWSALQKEVYEGVRARSPRMQFLVTGGEWGGKEGIMKSADLRDYARDANVIVTFHYYEPLLFTHQGVPWMPPGQFRFVTNLAWPREGGNKSDFEAALLRMRTDPKEEEGKKAADAAALSKLFTSFQKEGDPSHSDNAFSSIAYQLSEEGFSPQRILLGEFGVIRPTQAPSGQPRGSAEAYLLNVINAADRQGFQWAIWDWDTSFAVTCATNHDNVCMAYDGLVKGKSK